VRTRIIYDLKNDKRKIKQIQNATLNTKDFGLQIEHGLFGSKEWWEAINQGLIPIIQAEGEITKLHGDLPAIDPFIWFFTKSGNEEKRWTLSGEQSDYKIGKRVLIRYVIQKGKIKLSANDNLEAEIILSIEIEN
jgi:hypothetical protein